MRKIIAILIFSAVCALQSGAQTLTATYVALADSADRYMKAERWADAERVIVKALRHEPANKSNYLLWANLGVVRTNLQDYDGALEACDIGLATAPRSTALLSNRARVLLAKGQRAAAKEDLTEALAVDSTLQWPRKMRGILRAADGDTTGAEEDFKIYTSKYGDDAAILEAEGDMAAARGDVDKAVTKYRAAYALEPDENLLGRELLVAYSFGKIEDVADDIAEGLRKYPRNGTLYLIRAMLNKARYQTSAMESDLKTALEFGVSRELYDALTATPGEKK